MIYLPSVRMGASRRGGGVVVAAMMILLLVTCHAGRKTLQNSGGRRFTAPSLYKATTTRLYTITPRTTSATASVDGDVGLRGCRCSDGSEGCFCVNTDSCQHVHFFSRRPVEWRENECVDQELCCLLAAEAGDSGEQCGSQRLQVAGGNVPTGQAALGEAPWMALVLISEQHGGEAQWTQLCGGSLITMAVVLTAAHCIKGVTFEEMEVRVGEWDLSNSLPSQELMPQASSVDSMRVHEHYKEPSLVNDVALLFLRRRFTSSPNVVPVCLPTAEVSVRKEGCFATGWGRSTYGVFGNVSTTMHKADLQLLRRKECNEKLRKTRLGPYFTLNSNFMCALGSRNHEDVCQGDGGGPLVCPLRGAKPPVYVQMGVVSWGIDCGIQDVPGVYVDLTKYKHWITKQLEYGDGPKPTFYGGESP